MSIQNVNNKQHVSMNDGENKESITLIWFDPNTRSRKETEQTVRQLRLINDYVIFSSDLEECIRRIQLINKEIIFLITSGAKASQIVPRISSFDQINSIFIFNKEKTSYEDLLTKYSNIIGIYINLDDLCKSIKEEINFINKPIQTFSFIDQHQISIKDISKQSAKFLWYQLFYQTLSCLSRNPQAKQQMIQECTEYYDGNTKEMKFIHNFEKNYRSEDAIVWYSKRSFLYKLINKALRTQDIDLLYMFRFFIDDLSENFQCQHEKILSSQEKILNVYRGLKLHKQQLDRLKENKGKFISTNGYFSTSRSKEFALNFALRTTNKTDIVSILFHIQCDIEQTDKNILFADINQLSEYQDEQEVLFNLNACFQIESIEENTSLYIIKMNLSNQGQQITKNFIELIEKATEEMSISIILGRLLCDSGKYDKSLKYFQQLLNDSNDKDRAWIEFSIGRVHHIKDELNEAREYYDRAYDCMMKNKPARVKDSAHVLQQIGSILFHEEKYDDALNYYQRALKISEIFQPSGDVDTAQVLNKIGSIFSKQKKYDEAINCYQLELKIQEKFYPSDHADIATSLSKIGSILSVQEKNDEAMDHYQRALKIQEKLYPSGHLDTAMSLNSIAYILAKQAKYDDAFDYYQKALKIREQCYPSGHAETAISLNGIGYILLRQEKYDEAMDYHQRALKMIEELHPSGHTTAAISLHDIGYAFSKQKKYDEALDYYQRALKIQEKLYPSGHVDTVTTLSNMASDFLIQKTYDLALSYYQEALKIREKLYPSDHVDIAKSLDNIGYVLFQQGKYDEALGYYQKALKMRKTLYSSGHLDISMCLKNIGCIHYNQRKYGVALYYYEQAFKICKDLYPSGHINIGINLDMIGRCYENQKNRTKALEYYQQALPIYEKFLPHSDQRRQKLVNNIRWVSQKN
ncbi:unnamed protein product [Rotaria sordida]|uniref:ADP ribosyltransferase domain-containing protein n=1 Tax=Rotaria sordida TaxID=392033 RepID=A0A815EUK1_9BILA|nr:unnamed protein product [Rotaria sordida]